VIVAGSYARRMEAAKYASWMAEDRSEEVLWALTRAIHCSWILNLWLVREKLEYLSRVLLLFSKAQEQGFRFHFISEKKE
jgi:hypothetical protein